MAKKNNRIEKKIVEQGIVMEDGKIWKIAIISQVSRNGNSFRYKMTTEYYIYYILLSIILKQKDQGKKSQKKSCQ